MTQRRDFLRFLGAAAAMGSPLAALACRISPPPSVATPSEPPPIPHGDPWKDVPAILSRIVPPTFPARDFDITQFGAVAGQTSDSTDAIRRAIVACNAAGGGRVVVPPGGYLTGPIHLESNVNLYVSKGAALIFNRDPSQYLPAVLTRFEGMDLMNYSPFIYALDKTNIAVTGEGRLDGQAGPQYWWPWAGSAAFGWTKGSPSATAARDRLATMSEQGVPVGQRVFGEGDYLRPMFIQPYRCRNILIENVTIVNSPMWEIHPVLCQNVTVRGVHIDSLGPNNDGCEPESCSDVLIERGVFNTGGDCIAIKSGRNADGRRLNVPSQNIVVRNCEMRDGHGGVTIGSEISGGCSNVFVSDCHMDSPRLDGVLRLENNAMRGGNLHDIYMRDVTAGELADSVLNIDFFYEEGTAGPYTPIARNVELLRVTSLKSQYGIYLRGFPNAPIVDVRVIDCRFADVADANVTEYVQQLDLTGTTINGIVAR